MEAISPARPETEVEDTRAIGRKGARSGRVEIITRGDRRRSWTPELKREIVAESLGPELTPTEVARKHAIRAVSGGLSVSTVQQVVAALIWAEAVERDGDGAPQRFSASRFGALQQSFHLGEDLLDGVQIR